MVTYFKCLNSNPVAGAAGTVPTCKQTLTRSIGADATLDNTLAEPWAERAAKKSRLSADGSPGKPSDSDMPALWQAKPSMPWASA